MVAILYPCARNSRIPIESWNVPRKVQYQDTDDQQIPDDVNPAIIFEIQIGRINAENYVTENEWKCIRCHKVFATAKGITQHLEKNNRAQPHDRPYAHTAQRHFQTCVTLKYTEERMSENN